MTDGPSKGAIAFVPPRYGPGVVGGAEAVLAEMAHGLAARGWSVEVLTTCAQDHFTWDNHFPAGTETDGAVTVRRFPVVRDTDGADRHELSARILGGDRLTISEEQRWVNDSMRVPELWHHVLDHGDRYRAIVLAPYMFWTTFAVGQIHPGRTILMPCLHDEPEARLRIFQPLFAGARGIWFLSEPEAELAADLYTLPPRTAVVGAGMELPTGYDPDGFRDRHGIEGPFVYYAGRREGAKSWPELLEAYAEMRRTRGLDLTLVTSGIGPVDVPDEHPYDGVVDLGFISDHDRNDAMAAAAAYVQPSALESFSRTVLEAFAAGTPVIANAGSAVVAWHIDRTSAGVTYENRHQLVEALAALAEHPTAFRALAEGARGYVEAHYRPDVVLDQVEELLASWAPSEARA